MVRSPWASARAHVGSSLLCAALVACGGPGPTTAPPRPARAPPPPTPAATLLSIPESPPPAAEPRRVTLSRAPDVPVAVEVSHDPRAARCAVDLLVDLTAPIPELELEAKAPYPALTRFTTAEPPVDAQGCIREDGDGQLDRRTTQGHVGYTADEHRPFTLLLFKKGTRDPLASPLPVPATVPIWQRDVTRWFPFLLADDLESGELRGRVLAAAPRALFVFPRAVRPRPMAGASGQEPLVNEPLLIDHATLFGLDGLTFRLDLGSGLDEQIGKRSEALADAPDGPIALPTAGRRSKRRVEYLEGGSNARDFIAPFDLVHAHDEDARQLWMCHAHTGMRHESQGVSLTPGDVQRICSPFQKEMAQLAVRIEGSDRKARKPLLADLAARARALFRDAPGP